MVQARRVRRIGDRDRQGRTTHVGILIEPNKPWTTHVTDAQRAKLLVCIRDCSTRAAMEVDLKAKVQAHRATPGQP
jgi:hypothetical protein